MPKLYANTKIILPTKDGGEKQVDRHTVFDATVEQAKQLDALGSARPATDAEITAAEKAANIADGTAFLPLANAATSQDVAPPSIAENDPNGRPKGKTA